jgi:hypothetical protein
MGEVDTPEVGRIGRDFLKRCKGKRAGASVPFPSSSAGAVRLWSLGACAIVAQKRSSALTG